MSFRNVIRLVLAFLFFLYLMSWLYGIYELLGF